MIFSSSPTPHLDAPNWNQHQLHHGQFPSVAVDAHQQQHQLPLMAPQLGMATAASGSGGGAPGGSSVRPGSMAERARVAKIPQPGRKCPRCDSTNTKFCYFNNYSLSQPRHFCKTCRRYWTHGGTLRSVPVGGRCGRNKRSKSLKKHSNSSSSSSATASSSATSTSSSHAAAAAVLPPPPQSPFGLLHTLGHDCYSTMGASRLGFPGLRSSPHLGVDYELGGGLGPHRWSLPTTQQQFPFLTLADGVPPPPPGTSQLMPSGSYPFDGAASGNAEAASLAGQMLAGANVAGSAGLVRQIASVKMDDNPLSASTSSPREFLGLGGDLQFWGGGDNGGGGVAGGTANISAGGGSVADLSQLNNSPSGYTPL